MPNHKNSILRTLDASIISRLHLRAVAFEVGHQIEYPGNPITDLVFVEAGMASMTATFKDGGQVEVGTFGYEGVIGISALMGTKRSLNRVYTQIAGRGFVSPIEAARSEFAAGGVFQSLALRYVQAQLVQTMQSAGCNAKHAVDQRLARWLLTCADRAHSNEFSLSQDFLAGMLGATRPTVSTAAAILRAAGLMDYSRGKIRILDVEGLRNRSCECYGIIKSHLENYAEFSSGIIPNAANGSKVL